MRVNSKKETENNTYNNVFGDLASLSTDDSGEKNTFADDVINREVCAQKWREDLLEIGTDAWRWLRHRGNPEKIEHDNLWKSTRQDDKLLNKYRANNVGKLIVDDRVFPQLIPDIRQQIQSQIQRKRNKYINIEIIENIPKEIDAKTIWNAIKDNPDVSPAFKAALQTDSKKMELLVEETLNHSINQYKTFITKNTTGKTINFEIPQSSELPNPIRIGISRSGLVYDNPELVEQVTHTYVNAARQAAKNGKVTVTGNDINIDVRDAKNPGIKLQNIKLDKSRLDSEAGLIEGVRDKNISRVDKLRTDISKKTSPTKGDTKFVDGKKFIFNGKTWAVIGAAATLWYHKDQIPGAIESFQNKNTSTTISDSLGELSTPSQKDAYDSNKSHDSSPGVMQQVKPGGSTVPNQTTPRQDAWNKLKTPTPKKQNDVNNEDDGWWNAQPGSQRVYDDMGYIGGSDESWSRTAQKISPDDLDVPALANYGAEQIVSAQNFLAYYGLGAGKQPAEQIIPSLLMGNFNGMSFDEYRAAHTEEETRLAMQKFQQGLAMFSEEMSQLASNLEQFYIERQRRFESSTSTQKPNEQSK